VELRRGRLGYVQAASGAFCYLLRHLRAQDAALLARELVVEPVVRGEASVRLHTLLVPPSAPRTPH